MIPFQGPRGAACRHQGGHIDACHSFSSADSQQPQAMGFRALRVLSEDRVGPEPVLRRACIIRMWMIVTIILKGAIEHRDDLGNTAMIRAGEVQRMSCRDRHHATANAIPAPDERTHLLQICLDHSGGDGRCALLCPKIFRRRPVTQPLDHHRQRRRARRLADAATGCRDGNYPA